MVSEIFRTLRSGWAGHASVSADESGISNFKLSCKTIYIYHIKIRIIPLVVSEMRTNLRVPTF